MKEKGQDKLKWTRKNLRKKTSKKRNSNQYTQKNFIRYCIHKSRTAHYEKGKTENKKELLKIKYMVAKKNFTLIEILEDGQENVLEHNKAMRWTT